MIRREALRGLSVFRTPPSERCRRRSRPLRGASVVQGLRSHWTGLSQPEGMVCRCASGRRWGKCSCAISDGSQPNLRSNGAPPDFDRRLPPEMVKRRLVIVLNARLDRGAAIVVPLSTSPDPRKLSAGVNVEVPAQAICPLIHFTPSVRWAKADCVHAVSTLRLDLPSDARGAVHWVIELPLVQLIQRAVVRAINAGSMLTPPIDQAPPIDVGASHEEAS